VGKLTGVVDTLTDNLDITTCPPLDKIENSLVHEGVTTTSHVVGFQVDIACKAGYAVDGPNSVSCFPSGSYCESALFGIEACAKNTIPVCKACTNSNCAVCSPTDLDMCLECKDQRKFPVIYGGVCSAYASNCKTIYDAGLLPKKDGVTEVILRTKGSGKVHSALCAVVGTDAHTHAKCDVLSGTVVLSFLTQILHSRI
jgi:hypothetical protein